MMSAGMFLRYLLILYMQHARIRPFLQCPVHVLSGFFRPVSFSALEQYLWIVQLLLAIRRSACIGQSGTLAGFSCGSQQVLWTIQLSNRAHLKLVKHSRDFHRKAEASFLSMACQWNSGKESMRIFFPIQSSRNFWLWCFAFLEGNRGFRD